MFAGKYLEAKRASSSSARKLSLPEGAHSPELANIDGDGRTRVACSM
jgi:hypothetical protein